MMPIRKFIRNWTHRPFPRNLEGFRHAMVSYSQFGEDLMAQEVLGYDKKDVIYLDLGAFHPISYSNTYMFYLRGGCGLCVEPNLGLKPLWSKYRKRDRQIASGVTPGSTSSLFYHSFRDNPGTNYLSGTSDAASGCIVSEVPCLPIEQLVEEVLQMHSRLDLVSIDCEGMDCDLLKAFPFERVSPKVFIVEDFDFSSTSEIETEMKRHGYSCHSRARISKIFARN